MFSVSSGGQNSQKSTAQNEKGGGLAAASQASRLSRCASLAFEPGGGGVTFARGRHTRESLLASRLLSAESSGSSVPLHARLVLQELAASAFHIFTMPRNAEALSLARALLRAARTFPDYNMRECVALPAAEPPHRVSSARPRPAASSRLASASYIYRRTVQGFRERVAVPVRERPRCLWLAREVALPSLATCRAHTAQDEPALRAALEEARNQLALVRRQVRAVSALATLCAHTPRSPLSTACMRGRGSSPRTCWTCPEKHSDC